LYIRFPLRPPRISKLFLPNKRLVRGPMLSAIQSPWSFGLVLFFLVFAAALMPVHNDQSQYASAEYNLVVDEDLVIDEVNFLNVIANASVAMPTKYIDPNLVESQAKSVNFTSSTPANMVRRVIDGDTVRIQGMSQNTRLVGFNAPETLKAQCSNEAKLGQTAKSRLLELVSRADVQFNLVSCACRPGTEGTKQCNYGRACGQLFVGGQDVGEILISEGLAARFQCGAHSCPSTPKPWC
jgi:endonuclease YncB( thermonuclease family)